MPTLEPGEIEVTRLPGKLHGTAGNLLLTSRRLLFEHSSGIFSKQTYVGVNIPLTAIQNVTVGGSFLRKVVAVVAQGEGYVGVPRLEFEVGSPESLRQTIMVQVAARHSEIEDEKRRARIQIVMDFSFLRSQMERGGIRVASVKCPECGAPLSLPQQGSNTVCSHCGSMIHAQDVLDRMKGFLSSL